MRDPAMLLFALCFGCASVSDPVAVPTEPLVEASAEAVEEPAVGHPIPCAGLPAEGPELVRYTRYHYDAPERMERFVLVDRARGCPPDPMPAHLLATYSPEVCVSITTEAFAAVTAALRPYDLASLAVREEDGVHRGGVALELAWDGGSCRVGDVSADIRVLELDRDRFAEAVEVVRAAIERAP